MTPKTWIAANWKLNKSPRESRAFFEEWARVAGESKWDFGALGILFFPPATSLETVSQLRNAQSGFEFGAQNCCSESVGAFTGEISAQVVKELGGKFILVGHSERRSIFQETNALLAKKVALVQSLGLTPMLCIGESLEQRDKNQTHQVLSQQLTECLVNAKPGGALAVAYEPVWAIGTGKVATVEQVADAHAWIRKELERLGFTGTSILYGGSVKADNALALAKTKDVNGFLVGGASLEPHSFRQIIQAAQSDT